VPGEVALDKLCLSPCSSPGAFRFAHQLTRKPSDFDS